MFDEKKSTGSGFLQITIKSQTQNSKHLFLANKPSVHFSFEVQMYLAEDQYIISSCHLHVNGVIWNIPINID